MEMSNALADTSHAVGLADGYASWKQDVGQYHTAK